MKFSEQLRAAVDTSWNASFEHPFVRGIGDGTLPLDCFRHYVLNDAYYLSQFARVQALGAAKAGDLYTVNRMAVHAQGTQARSFPCMRSSPSCSASPRKNTRRSSRRLRPTPTPRICCARLIPARSATSWQPSCLVIGCTTKSVSGCSPARLTNRFTANGSQLMAVNGSVSWWRSRLRGLTSSRSRRPKPIANG